MNITRAIYILMTALLMTGCVNDALDVPGISESPILAISFTTDVYSGDMTRTESEEELCWSEWNEKKITNLDFYLVDKDGYITFYHNLLDETDDCNVIHKLIEFGEDGISNSNMGNLTFDDVAKASRIAMVANYPLSDQNRVGKKLDDLYSDIITFSGNSYKERQEKFVMTGIVDLPEKVSKYTNIVVPLRRIIAKIRVRVMDKAGNYLTADQFNSVLCRYSDNVNILPDALMPEFKDNGYGDGSKIYPANIEPTGRFAGDENWEYPTDITDIHPTDMVKDEGHVYYTCPYDWVDYGKVKNSCSRGTNHSHGSESRYEITDCDDTAPILAEREMFLLIKAPYTYTVYKEPTEEETEQTTEEVTSQFLYKVPINYRISVINDQQCFSRNDLINKVFNLYRAERNHFYDITVLIDSPGYPVAQ